MRFRKENNIHFPVGSYGIFVKFAWLPKRVVTKHSKVAGVYKDETEVVWFEEYYSVAQSLPKHGVYSGEDNSCYWEEFISLSREEAFRVFQLIGLYSKVNDHGFSRIESCFIPLIRQPPTEGTGHKWAFHDESLFCHVNYTTIPPSTLTYVPKTKEIHERETT